MSDAQPNLEPQDREFLNYAIQAANWIEANEIQDGEMTRWPSTPSLSKTVSYDLYSGSSGIVIFYLQLHRATGDAKYLETAKRGANALLAQVDTLNEESDPGYWTGYSGIAATLAETYRATNEPKYRKGFKRCFDLLVKRVQAIPGSKNSGVNFNSVTDIIGGSAGIGFFLLYANEILKEERALKLAGQVADGLIHVGQPLLLDDQTTGLRWMMSPDFPREMPNYSHGTAGVCDFLLALDSRLNAQKDEAAAKDYDGRFRNAAVAGAKYLASLVDKESACLILHHRNLDAKPDAEEPLYYLGWCHGPSGTGRLFLNLAKQFPDQKQWKQLADRGGSYFLASDISSNRLPGYWNNVGVCCGASGVGSYALELWQVTEDPQLKELALRLARDTISRATIHNFNGNKIGLSWTHAEHRVRPEFLHAQTGLMQGAAGIGLWFLKLDAAMNGKEFEVGLPLQPLE